MYCLIEINGKQSLERDSFKEVKKEVNAGLKNKKKVFLNGKRVEVPFTREDWIKMERGLLLK